MTVLGDNDPRFRALPWKVAAFVLAALVGAAASVVLFAWHQGYFEPKTPLTFVSDTGNDLRVGMAVKFSGFTIGEVKTLTLDDKGRVRIAVLIENRYMKWIRTDSIGKVGKDGLIGDAYIDVGIGDLRKPEVEPNTELEFVSSRSMDDVMREVRDRAMPVINELEQEVHFLSGPNSDLNRSMTNLREFTEGLKGTRERVDKVLDNLDKVTGKDVPATLETSRMALLRVDNVLKDVEGRLPTMMDHANTTLQHLEATSATVHKIVDQSGPDAVGLVREGHELARKGNVVVDGVERSWPLNKMISPAPTQAPSSDSQGLGQ